jgi:hypothetical protein
MSVRDAEKLGAAADLVSRLRLGPSRGAEALAEAPILGQVLREAVEMAEIGPEDNVLLLGGHDQRPIPWIASRCRTLTVLEDLPDERLAALETEGRAKGLENVRLRYWRTGSIAAPQGTADRVLSLNFLYRCLDPEVVCYELTWASHHGCLVVLCEPSASLDDRTARKYSREADLSAEDHRALIRYAKIATIQRRFTHEGLTALMTRQGIKDVEVRELLHGLVLAATGRVEV